VPLFSRLLYAGVQVYNLPFSPSAVDDIADQGVRSAVIGYTINFAGFDRKEELLKALTGYISTDTTKRINLKAAQRLASYGSQYGRICRVMRPFSSALHRMTWDRRSSHTVFWLPEEAIIAIRCWRAMLCLVQFRETECARSIESFTPDTPTLLAEFERESEFHGPPAPLPQLEKLWE
jgi:hypothetical protein